MGDIGRKRLFLLDMDGTIYLDNDLFPGTKPFLDWVRERDGRYLFLTNNSSRSAAAYVEKLGRLGIEAEKKDFLTSVDALIADLQAGVPRRLCYLFGTESFRSQLSQAGIPVTDRLEEGIDCLLIGFDTELTFQKLEDACILLGRGVDFIATNPDWVCPTWYGSTAPCRIAAVSARCSSGPQGAGPGSSASPSGPWWTWRLIAPASRQKRPWW